MQTAKNAAPAASVNVVQIKNGSYMIQTGSKVTIIQFT